MRFSFLLYPGHFFFFSCVNGSVIIDTLAFLFFFLKTHITIFPVYLLSFQWHATTLTCCHMQTLSQFLFLPHRFLSWQVTQSRIAMSPRQKRPTWTWLLASTSSSWLRWSSWTKGDWESDETSVLWLIQIPQIVLWRFHLMDTHTHTHKRQFLLGVF